MKIKLFEEYCLEDLEGSVNCYLDGLNMFNTSVSISYKIYVDSNKDSKYTAMVTTEIVN